jgi:hypothetical protein
MNALIGDCHMNRIIAALVAGMFAAAAAGAFAAQPEEPGRVNDPASAEKKAPAHKPVQAAGAHQETPGRANDPCAAGQGTAAGGDIKCEPEMSAKTPGREGDPVSPEKK